MFGRIFSISFKQFERLCLRLLLIEVKGATSFEDLLTVDGVLHATFKSTAAARNLFENDIVRSKTMAEAAPYAMSLELRQLFMDMCIHCSLSDLRSIFDTNINHLTDGYVRCGHYEGKVVVRLIGEVLRMQLNDVRKQMFNTFLTSTDEEVFNRPFSSL